MITYLSPKCLKSVGKMKKTDFFPQNQDSDNPGQKSLGQYCNIHIFLSFLGSLLNRASFLKFSCSSPFPHPIQSWNLEKILDTPSNIVCGVKGGRGWTCVNWKMPQTCKLKCPKTIVHDCSMSLLFACIGKIQLVVYYQCCILIGWATI